MVIIQRGVISERSTCNECFFHGIIIIWSAYSRGGGAYHHGCHEKQERNVNDFPRGSSEELESVGENYSYKNPHRRHYILFMH